MSQNGDLLANSIRDYAAHLREQSKLGEHKQLILNNLKREKKSSSIVFDNLRDQLESFKSSNDSIRIVSFQNKKEECLEFILQFKCETCFKFRFDLVAVAVVASDEFAFK